jgi:hypothetical protein
MDLVFVQGKSVEITFKVGVAGTAVAPQSVFVSFARDGKITSFTASKYGEEYKALVEFPGYLLGIGEVDFSINVRLNDRIFTPFKSIANILSDQVESNIEPPKENTRAIVPEVIPEIDNEIPTALDFNFEAKKEIVKPPKKSLMKMIEPIQPKILKPKVIEDTTPKFSIKKIKVIFK